MSGIVREITVTVFVCQDRRVLLLHHKGHDLWVPPGGHLEANEDLNQTALREVLEETGLKVHLVGEKGLPPFKGLLLSSSNNVSSGDDVLPQQLILPQGIQVETISPDHQHIDFIYFAVPEDPAIDPLACNESHDIGWFTLEEASELKTFPDVPIWMKRAIAATGGDAGGHHSNELNPGIMAQRESIIRALHQNLKQDPDVHALWLEGADAHGLVDDYSDIDIWVDASDGQEDRVMAAIAAALEGLAPIDWSYQRAHTHPQIRQAFFRLKDYWPFLVLDICVQSHSRDVVFTHEHEDEKVKVLFDRGGVIKYQHWDPVAFEDDVARCRRELVATFPLYLGWVKKAIHRGDYLEAFSYYTLNLLKALTEALRLRYQPTKGSYHLKHVSRDLPRDEVTLLEDLHRVASLKDIELNLPRAEQAFQRVISN